MNSASVRLRLGKIVSMHVYHDTGAVGEVCRAMAKQGIEEVAAPFIEQ